MPASQGVVGKTNLRCKSEPLEPDPVNTGVGMGANTKSNVGLGKRIILRGSSCPYALNRVFLYYLRINPMKKPRYLLALLALPLTATAQTELSTQTVKADFRHTHVQQLPEATTVVGSEQIDARSAEHLEQILSVAPNVNFSSGSSRGRYYLIRGIGERSQFIDPINPSVGLMIDGIDMTGLGAAATLFDIQQVEILRGPQGTRFGANSLGGLINITSAEPTETNEGYISGKVGNYNSYGLGTAVSGGLTSNLQGRIAVNHFQSDGYMENKYLGRKDTNNFNETIVRGKLAWQPSTDSELKLTYLFADIDNGFDAFTVDNSRLSKADEPGIDTQETHALALNYQQRMNSAVSLEATISGSTNDAVYSYDDDWVNSDYGERYGKKVFDEYNRAFNRGSVDVRLLSGTEGRVFNDSTDWVVGVYGMGRNERLDRIKTGKAPYNNKLTTSSYSFYTEFSTQLSSSSRLIYGVRAEHWENDFNTSKAVTDSTDEWLGGGKVTFEQMLGLDHLTYLSYARGYKAGGVNSDPDVSADNRTFDTEHNNTYELGLKSSMLDDSLTTRMAVFYTQRLDQQVKSSYSIPNTIEFQDYLANAAEGRNYGLELESNWQLTENLSWELSYGYLNTEFIDYSRNQNILDANYNVIGSEVVDKTGREQAHAPKHSGATAITYKVIPNLSLRLEAEGKDEFYFSDSHDEKARGHVIYHARLSYKKPNYELALSGRNLSDKETDTRGFGGFNNDIKNQSSSRYVQLGEPRLVMLEGKYKF